MSEAKHYWLYALRLEEDKYYIGITSKRDPQDRIKEHMNGFYSAQWVKKYKAIEAVETIDLDVITTEEAERQELKRTLQYMKKYGYQNVRGGRLNYSGKYLRVRANFYKDTQVYLFLGLFMMTISVLVLILIAWK